MAHHEQLCFMNTLAMHLSQNYKDMRILEIGSYQVNGSLRDFFTASTYCGVDLTPGPGVDLVADGHLLDHQDDSYDLTLSCECFEHNPFWKETFLNMYRMTKPGGIVSFTCATRGRIEHGTIRTLPKTSPGTQTMGWNYYLNLREKDFKKYISFEKLFSSSLFLVNKKSKDLYFVGQKKGGPQVLNFCKEAFIHAHVLAQKKLEDDCVANSRPQRKKFKPVSLFLRCLVAGVSFLPDKHYQNFMYCLETRKKQIKKWLKRSQPRHG